MEPLEYLHSPDWKVLIGKDTLTIQAPSQSEATELADTASEQLALAIANLKFKSAKIIWENCQRPFKILAAMADDNETPAPSPIVTPMIFGMNFNYDAADLRILAQMQESEKPMSLVGMTGRNEDIQRFANAPLLAMLQRPRDYACQLDLTTLWQPDSLEDLKRELWRSRLTSWNNYRAALPWTPAAQFSSSFEMVEFTLYPDAPKIPMRLVTIHNYEPIEQAAWV
ncbi:hypothetical protein WA1_51630 [Scytonema hofmannii PCC 7110]|uniref:Uncharacterized protein n=1 Tax=Scytonema hofmannii PCC 7110 TaxID=128403 RepID=A0A139WPZ0_9CYAN|nr:hypothetical protein [Scytonema hofmannii]KYC34496.1 hypothetical protein WA1_51630 [Scytonema hofmannii PCC 7110]